jgi:hypothetical protein
MGQNLMAVLRIINQLNFKKMKKPNFSLEKFANSNVTTLEAGELNLVLGASALADMCSVSHDSDPQSENCSYSDDKDGVKTGLEDMG